MPRPVFPALVSSLLALVLPARAPAQHAAATPPLVVGARVTVPVRR